jgi:hypothetical protein
MLAAIKQIIQSLPAHCQDHPLWHLCGLTLFLALCVINHQAKRSGIFLLAIWNLAGVILHELSHLLVGILFRAQPTNISLIPRRSGTCWQLGAVRFARITAVNAVPIACAPLGLALVAYLVANSWFTWLHSSLTITLALYTVLFILLYNALPSRQDLRVATNWRSLVLYGSILALVAALYYYAH